MTDHSGGETCIGIALGSGSARGWAHIGVLQELAAAGIRPHVLAGTSIGSVVGAWYARGHLDASEGWVRSLTRREVMRYMDLAFTGGLLEGRRLIEVYRQRWGDIQVEELPMPYTAVATNLSTGQEVWLQKGSLLEAVRASISLPGLFKPVRHGEHWLVDGGLVNPVPITACRAMGANLVIAVNLNGDLVGRRRRSEPSRSSMVSDVTWWERVSSVFSRNGKSEKEEAPTGPGFFDVLSSSINIMQDRITRSRMAGDPPEIVIAPRLEHLELMDYARGGEAIEEGRAAVRRMLPLIEDVLGLSGELAAGPNALEAQD
jgi:NTE family protein